MVGGYVCLCSIVMTELWAFIIIFNDYNATEICIIFSWVQIILLLVNTNPNIKKIKRFHVLVSCIYCMVIYMKHAGNRTWIQYRISVWWTLWIVELMFGYMKCKIIMGKTIWKWCLNEYMKWFSRSVGGYGRQETNFMCLWEETVPYIFNDMVFDARKAFWTGCMPSIWD